MIPADFIYCRPETEAEAVSVFVELRGHGRTALYYGGGSEIITMTTAGSIRPDAVIDLKGIPGLDAIEAAGDRIRIGGAATLDAILSSGTYPLLGEVGARIADHTNQCRITLGGNLCGTVRYRETALPLLLADADVALFGPEGARTVPLKSCFDGRMRLLPGEFIAFVEFSGALARLPYAHIKKTFSEKIGYPAVTLACLFEGDRIRAAFSGIGQGPFRSEPIEAILSERDRSPEWRAERASKLLPGPPMADAEGSAEYRLFLFRDQLQRVLERGAEAENALRAKGRA